MKDNLEKLSWKLWSNKERLRMATEIGLANLEGVNFRKEASYYLVATYQEALKPLFQKAFKSLG